MRSYTVGSVWGIPIRINISLVVFLPVLAWLIGSGEQIAVYAGVIGGLTGVAFDVPALRAGATPWLVGSTAAVGLFVSVAVHELGHSWVALRYGLEIESITLWILGGLAALSEVPREWDRELTIAAAGPLVSVVLGGVLWGATLATPASLAPLRFVLGWLAVTNVGLAAFNLLPAFPMDGGRILRALLARSRPYASATRIAGRVGVVFAVLFAVVGVLQFSPLLLLLALFVYGAATTESRAVVLDDLLEGLTVGDVMSRDPPTVAADATVAEFADRMLRDRQTAYAVTDGGEVVGVATLDDLRGVRDREGTTVGAVAGAAGRIAAAGDAFDGFVALTSSGASHALVEDGGRVVGLLSEGDYAHALTIQRGFQAATPLA
ncbi:MAG: site-2 protease family protein [Halobacteriaceae archaeon]